MRLRTVGAPITVPFQALRLLRYPSGSQQLQHDRQMQSLQEPGPERCGIRESVDHWASVSAFLHPPESDSRSGRFGMQFLYTTEEPGL